MDAIALLLSTALRNRLDESNIEAGYERFSALSGGGLPFAVFRDAVAACVRDGLVREPIRLPDGALQCHWHLELTAAGVAAARRRPTAAPGELPLRTRTVFPT